MRKKKITLLSLDGGGIRGIISCVLLRYLEQQLQKLDDPQAKIGDYFDLIAGSSTGGLITSVLLFPNTQNQAKYSIEKALELYTQKGKTIFQTSFWEELINPLGLFNEKIEAEHIEKELQDFFGNLELKELIKPCVITAYDTENRKVKIFNSLDGTDDIENFYVKDVCRATSAAPTYFEPARIRSKYGQDFTLIDGGMYANNPALCAYAEARKINFSKVLNDDLKPDKPSIDQMIMVSMSTGGVLKSYPYVKFKDAGKLKWIQPIIDILLSSNAEAVDYQLKQMYLTLGKFNQKNYYRIDPPLKNASPEMDNTHPKNIEALIQAALSYINDNKLIFEEIAKKLIKNKTKS